MDMDIVIHIACLVGWMGRAIFLFVRWISVGWGETGRFIFLFGWMDGITMLIMSYGTHLSFIYLLSKHSHVRSYFVDLIKTNTMM
jgi:hypothetical protein